MVACRCVLIIFGEAYIKHTFALCVCVCVCACVRACVGACVRARACVHACVCDWTLLHNVGRLTQHGFPFVLVPCEACGFSLCCPAIRMQCERA